MKCIFCKISRSERGKLIYEDNQIVAFHDIEPQAPIHVLIIPRRHIVTINDLSHEDKKLIGHMVTTSVQIARNKDIANFGYRLVFNCNYDGGQIVDHIHLHLLGGRKMKWPPG
ncbi:histidine triad nucleotide-binding protein [Coxiella endosymbiont of Amblyomma sculptum]|uniref:histidine triad nucleotide-binding protein n=1 Tax=Coxiella endosymbiont of Amblyomma sculptum TaxID=2487929 RepID=UPI00132F1408|nr:histidine triad nucleotide-binding protein [Coxiella endosymbiont of Amblyomma sculptum]QHG92541.1 histidine triad nucleotide-binding protein [Coxiella endosymbiont of Amblyomma sculptum]